MYIYVSLIDPEFSQMAQILLHQFWRKNIGASATLGTFVQMLRVLFAEDMEERSKISPEDLTDFLLEVRDYAPDFVAEIVQSFEKNFPDEYAASPLAELL